MTEFSLGLTGDINDIMNAHNLAMTALNARMQHERNYDDEKLAQRGLRRLDIDPSGCSGALCWISAARRCGKCVSAWAGEDGRLSHGHLRQHRRQLRS